MKLPRKRRDDEPSFRFKLGWSGFETSASGTVGIVTAAALAVIALVLLHLPFLR